MLLLTCYCHPVCFWIALPHLTTPRLSLSPKEKTKKERITTETRESRVNTVKAITGELTEKHTSRSPLED